MATEQSDRRESVRRHQDRTVRAEVTNLQAAMETRGTIGIAVGMVMASYGIDAETAFAYLTRLSNDSNVKLRDAAAKLVADFAASGNVPPPLREDGTP